MNERNLFEAALEIDDPQTRLRFLDKACQGNAGLRFRVDGLLQSHAAGEEFPDSPAANQMGQRSATATDKTFIGTIGGEHDDNRADFGFLQPSMKAGSIGSLAHYEIQQVLGRGAFGKVFKAFDEKLRRLVAIKVINAEIAASSASYKRFLREARSAAAIKHENMVQIYSVGEQPLPYLVMEYIDGQTLEQLMHGKGPLPVDEVLAIGQQIAAGLAAAHARGLIHRDIKPGNILLERGVEQKVKITDFGLARAADELALTQAGIISGTPMYMAPEQALGQPLDHRSDLFSLGSVLYEMACGHPPFSAPTAITVLRRVAEESPRPITESLPGLPNWLVEIIRKLHAKKPDERFQTAREVAELLARCRDELRLAGKVTMPSKSEHPAAVNTAASGTDVKTVQPVVMPGGSGSKRFLAWGGAFVLVVLAVIAILMKNNGAQQKVDVPENNSKGETAAPTDIAEIDWRGWPEDAPPAAIAPFDAAKAKNHQQAWAEYLRVPIEYENSLGMKFVLIPPGEFTMGSTAAQIQETFKTLRDDDKQLRDCVKSESPQHQVILTRAIYMGVTEVTQRQYETIMGKNPSYFAETGQNALFAGKVASLDTANFPVEGVSWNDAAEFCAKLSQKEDLKPFYLRDGETITFADGTGYRLPREAEWEFACRAGTNTRFWMGNTETDLSQAGWFFRNARERTHLAGETKSNPLGLRDMHGNVWEWVEDWWDPKYYGQFPTKPAVDPRGTATAGSRRVYRGGGFNNPATRCRSSHRDSSPPAYRGVIGFRVVLMPASSNVDR